MEKFVFVYNTNVKSKDELLSFIDKKMSDLKIATQENAVKKALLAREAISNTGLEAQLGIPHMHGDAVKKLTVVVLRNDVPIDDYTCLDQTKVKLAIALLMPSSADQVHVKILGSISALFIDHSNITNFLNDDASKVEKVLTDLANKVLKEHEAEVKKVETKKPATSQTKKDNNQSKIEKTATTSSDKKISSPSKTNDKKLVVAITSCAVGIAHTYMAGKAIEKYCNEQGFKHDVEKQGSMSDKFTIDPENIALADVILIAADKTIRGLDRFEGKKVYMCSTQKAIKSTKEVVSAALNSPLVLNNGKPVAATSAPKKGSSKSSKDEHNVAAKQESKGLFDIKLNNKWFKHLLAGISVMIPCIVLAGIFTAIALGFFTKGHDANGAPIFTSFGQVVSAIGKVGFMLYSPILSAGIAYSIAGRAGLVPGLVVGLLVSVGTTNGDASLSTMFNYQTLSFGYTKFLGVSFNNGYSLGFIGGIATGFAAGYTTLIFTEKIKWHSVVMTIVPILVIPIFVTLIDWALFAFALVIPLLAIAAGLHLFLNVLQGANLLFILAFIMGAMIAVDVGGPINKTAFLFAAGLIKTNPEIMGFVGVAIAVPPLMCGLAAVSGYKMKFFDKTDLSAGISALFLAFFGITEGAIPFYLRHPKVIPACSILVSAIASALTSLTLASDSAAQGGIIVYLIGAVGKNGITDYVFGLWYVLFIVLGGVVGAVLILLTVFVAQKVSRKNKAPAKSVVSTTAKKASFLSTLKKGKAAPKAKANVKSNFTLVPTMRKVPLLA